MEIFVTKKELKENYKYHDTDPLSTTIGRYSTGYKDIYKDIDGKLFMLEYEEDNETGQIEYYHGDNAISLVRVYPEIVQVIRYSESPQND